MSLGDSLHLVDGELASVGHALAEEGVAIVDIGLQVAQFLSVEGTRAGAEGRIAVGLHLVELQTELLCHELRTVGEHTEDADGTRERGGLSEDVVRAAADVVAARGSIAAHRHYHRLLGLEQFHLMPDLLGGIGRAAAGVHADDHRLHVVVVGQRLQVLVHLVAHNLVTAAHDDTLRGIVDDVAISVVDGNLLAVALLLHVLHLSDAHLADILVVVELQQLLHLSLHLVVIEQCIDELQLLQRLRALEHHEAVGIGIQRVDGNLTAVADGLHHVAPDTVDIGLRLFAVGIAHVVLGIHLSGALILADLHHLHLDTHLAQQVLHEHGLGGDAVPVDVASRIQPNLVGHRAKIIGALRIGVAIGHNPLTRFLEVE